MTGVWEDPGSSPHLNYETDYQYDANDNLICAAQKGTSSGTFTNCGSVIGNYAVDSSTGDVWSATECEEESTPELRKLQANVRLRIGLSDSEYHKIKRKGPVCP